MNAAVDWWHEVSDTAPTDEPVPLASMDGIPADTTAMPDAAPIDPKRVAATQALLDASDPDSPSLWEAPPQAISPPQAAPPAPIEDPAAFERELLAEATNNTLTAVAREARRSALSVVETLRALPSSRPMEAEALTEPEPNQPVAPVAERRLRADDLPATFLRRATVKVPRAHEDGTMQFFEVSAREALADLDSEERAIARLAGRLGQGLKTALLAAELRDFDTRPIVEAARDYAGRGMSPSEAEQRAVIDYARDLDAERARVEADVEKQFAKFDPERHAEILASPPAEVRSGSAIGGAAHEAATSPKNDLQEPTEAQKRAGNYRKGHLRYQGLDIVIENPIGSTRSGTDLNGQPWEVEMSAHYGYLKRTASRDGEPLDVYVVERPDPDAPVFVVDQVDPRSRRLDEHKAIVGVTSEDEAAGVYDAHFSDGSGPERRRAITEMSMDEFKQWLKHGDTTRAAATVAKEAA